MPKTFIAIISFIATTSTVTTVLPIAPSVSAPSGSSSHPLPSYWWEGDPSKEIPEVKAALREAEGQQTLTGYEDKDVLIPLIKKSLRENQTGGVDEVRFVRLCALVYRGRNAPGIEDEPYYKTAKNHTDLVLTHWDRKVDSLSFMRMCTLMQHEFGYSGPSSDTDFIATLIPYVKDDPVFDEALVEYMGYRYQKFGGKQILEKARALANRDRATVINARTSGFAIRTVGFFEKNPQLLRESAGLLKKYRDGMQPADAESREKFDQHIKWLRAQADLMK